MVILLPGVSLIFTQPKYHFLISTSQSSVIWCVLAERQWSLCFQHLYGHLQQVQTISFLMEEKLSKSIFNKRLLHCNSCKQLWGRSRKGIWCRLCSFVKLNLNRAGNLCNLGYCCRILRKSDWSSCDCLYALQSDLPCTLQLQILLGSRTSVSWVWNYIASRKARESLLDALIKQNFISGYW